MADPFFDAIEREQLADLLDELGPDAPTLLDPWTTRDLASHLVLREHDLVAAPGLVIPGSWGRFAERRRKALARRDFSWLVETIRSGPPRGFFRTNWVRRLPNLNEFFVHHEDVRRANGFAVRANPPGMDAALWRNVGFSRRFLSRRLRGISLELEWAGTGRTASGKGGRTTATIVGLPGELLLYLFGRQGVAHVEVRGPADAVNAVGLTQFGM
ncbi:TIGR03085 family metal-binding protein [Mycolicibacterium aubagnense]